MTDPRTLAREAQERASNATAGPWVAEMRGRSLCVREADAPGFVMSIARVPSRVHQTEIAAFIAAARTDVPALASALIAALDRLERAEAALQLFVHYDKDESDGVMLMLNYENAIGAARAYFKETDRE